MANVNTPKKTMGLGRIGAVFLFVVAVIGILMAIPYTRKAIMDFFNKLFNKNGCDPTADERTAAGGDGVLTFTKDSSGNCVAATCNTSAGYNLYQGVCYPCSAKGDVKVTIPDGYSAIYDNQTETVLASPFVAFKNNACVPSYIESNYGTDCASNCASDTSLSGIWGTGGSCFKSGDDCYTSTNKKCVCIPPN